MKQKLFSALLIAALGTPFAAAAQTGEGHRLSVLGFTSIDTDGTGQVTKEQFVEYGGDVFFSMDYDENSSVSLKEFLSWGFGMEQVAEEAGRKAAYETALRVVFAFWDLDGDNSISSQEHQQSLSTDFQRADSNGDGSLSESEFLNGFSVNIAMRAAINPPAAE